MTKIRSITNFGKDVCGGVKTSGKKKASNN